MKSRLYSSSSSVSTEVMDEAMSKKGWSRYSTQSQMLQHTLHFEQSKRSRYLKDILIYKNTSFYIKNVCISRETIYNVSCQVWKCLLPLMIQPKQLIHKNECMPWLSLVCGVKIIVHDRGGAIMALRYRGSVLVHESIPWAGIDQIFIWTSTESQ